MPYSQSYFLINMRMESGRHTVDRVHLFSMKALLAPLLVRCGRPTNTPPSVVICRVTETGNVGNAKRAVTAEYEVRSNRTYVAKRYNIPNTNVWQSSGVLPRRIFRALSKSTQSDSAWTLSNGVPQYVLAGDDSNIMNPDAIENFRLFVDPNLFRGPSFYDRCCSFLKKLFKR